ncbi:helix-turn-helix domain-containing protein [Candidatus Pacearchaeota archaeon]|nr:helix-turn-helix domain-containing protein [Candidatus Pacearchaeota archaeon]
MVFDKRKCYLEEIIKQVKNIADNHYSDYTLSLKTLADRWDLCRLGINSEMLGKSFKEAYGKTFHQRLTYSRIKKAKELLREKWISNVFLSRFVGFSSHSYFFQAFRKETGMSPAEYKERHSRT